ncbi:HDOD domain-containing protein [Castellaniella sp. GW247-6E4]|uniref:EAL and HDOD domain-containing protein n=1 Tax=Castellaniella sp. GW247-6E4 TaxID=3140380 RepID=UPI003316255C
MGPTATLAETGASGQNPAAPLCLMRREPALDKDRSLVGYILRPLWLDDQPHDPGEAIIAQCRRHDVNQVLGFLPHEFTASPGLVDQPFVHMLPHNRALLDIPEGLEVTPELIQSFAGMSRSGLRFTIRADLAAEPAYEPLLPFCRAVRFDPERSSKADIFRQSLPHKQAGRKLHLTALRSQDELNTAVLLGFTQFRGAWPAPTGAAVALSTRQKLLLKLITLIMGDSEIPEIQACLEQDRELVKTLLNMVNTPAFGLPKEVESLNQAIMLLGRRQLQRWIQMLMYTESGRPKGYLSPILVQASARAYLLEQLSLLRHPEQSVRADAAFTTGMLSTMDHLFGGMPMRDLLGQVMVDTPVRQALLERTGPLGPDLRLAVLAFPLVEDTLENPAPLMAELAIDAERLAALIQQAFEWGHTMTQAAQ